jgi:predicted DNA-binding transcriptional regulator YafY
MKADRLLSAILLLQAHGRLSTRVLSERLEVSQRTAHRDMESLAAAGVPVFALRGAQGGWQLEDGWRVRVPGFDEHELRALLMSQPRVTGSTRLAASAERALTKLTAALPEAMRERVASIRKRLHVDATSWYGGNEDLAALPIVQDAVSSDRMLLFNYHPPGREPAERRVGPLGLVAKGTTWYLVASAANGLRTYRVSRIERPVILDEPFERPAEFDLATYWAASTERFSRAFHYATRLRLEPAAAASIRQWCRVLPDESSPAADADGRVTLAVDFDGEGHATFVVLGLGARVEVVEPAALRERVAAETAAMFRRLG